LTWQLLAYTIMPMASPAEQVHLTEFLISVSKTVLATTGPLVLSAGLLVYRWNRKRHHSLFTSRFFALFSMMTLWPYL